MTFIPDGNPAEETVEDENPDAESPEPEDSGEQEGEAAPPETADKEEEVADEALVNEAYDKVSEIVVRRLSETMEEVGEYLLKTFFGDDIAKAQSNSPTKAKSLNALIKKIRKTQGDSPSRTWLYNSVKLVADKRLFEKEGLPEYQKLGHSHKVYLTHLGDLGKKKELIKEAVQKNYTVAKLKKRIAEEKGSMPIGSLANLPQEEALGKWSLEKLESMHAKAEENIKKLTERLKAYKESKWQLESVIDEKKQEESAVEGVSG